MILYFTLTAVTVCLLYIVFRNERFYRSFFVIYLLFVVQNAPVQMAKYIDTQDLIAIAIFLMLYGLCMLHLVWRKKHRLLPLYRKKTIARLFQVWLGYSLNLIFIAWQIGELTPEHLYLWLMTAVMPIIYAVVSLWGLPKAARIAGAQ